LSSLTVRDFEENDIDSVRNLFSEVFQEAPPREYFVWKILNNPAGRGINVVAEDSGKIVGHASLKPTKLCIGNELVVGAQGVDSMVHPTYPGIFASLLKTCMERAVVQKVEVGYGCPNNNIYLKFYNPVLVHMLNWVKIGEIPHWSRVLRTGSHEAVPRARAIASWGLQRLPMGNKSPSGINVRAERPADEELASLADVVSSNLPPRSCRIERSREWFKWRFDDPSCLYHWFSAYRGRDLMAWAAFGVNGWSGIPLIDMAGSDSKAIEAVVSAATRNAKKLGLASLGSVTNDDNAIRALKSCGYIHYRDHHLIVKSFTTRILNANVHLFPSWRITSQDLDAF